MWKTDTENEHMISCNCMYKMQKILQYYQLKLKTSCTI